MSAAFDLAPDIAWVEGAAGGREEPVVWISHLPSGVQFELVDTGWLIWVLLADGIRHIGDLEKEISRIREESGLHSVDEAVETSTLTAFLDGLVDDGLLVRT